MSLSEIQTKLKANKSQFNKFGNYSYRSLEDITEALKPLLIEYNAYFIINHEPFELGGKLFDKATATITFLGDAKESYSSTSYAELLVGAKGMSNPQMSGATQSYSGKYAANGLFALDDNKDPDSMDNSKDNRPTASKATDQDKARMWNEFKSYCERESVDAVEFLEWSGLDMTEKAKVHNAVNKFLKSGQMLTDQLLTFKNRDGN